LTADFAKLIEINLLYFRPEHSRLMGKKHF